MAVHPTAVVSDNARLGQRVSVGPFAVIGAATLGDDVVVHPHAIISDGADIGARVEVFPGAFIGKEPKGAGATARTPHFDRRVLIGDDCSIGPHAVIYYDVEIGASTLIGDGASIREQCRIGAKCIISRYVTINYNTIVEDHCKVMDLTHLTGNMRLGRGSFVSTMVGTANDNLITAGYGEHVVGPTIGAGAVVGAGSTLLPGVHIGDSAIVGAGSTVTKDVPEGATVMGPAARPRS